MAKSGPYDMKVWAPSLQLDALKASGLGFREFRGLGCRGSYSKVHVPNLLATRA